MREENEHEFLRRLHDALFAIERREAVQRDGVTRLEVWRLRQMVAERLASAVSVHMKRAAAGGGGHA